jgi:hypothetical protein
MILSSRLHYNSRSEEAGLQLLGPETEAIVRVRCISGVTSALIQNVAFICYGQQSAIFSFLYDAGDAESRPLKILKCWLDSLVDYFPIIIEPEPASILDEVMENPVKLVYGLLPLTSLVINLAAKVASEQEKRMLRLASMSQPTGN